MKRIEITSDADFAEAAAAIAQRGAEAEDSAFREQAFAAVREVVETVRTEGDAAVSQYTERFDGCALSPADFEIPEREISQAMDAIEPEIRIALERAADNIAAFHLRNRRESWREEQSDGSILGQRVTPLESAGVYVPGGKAFYPSSVLMNIIPAKAAGVKDIIMVSPPSYNGTIHPLVLAAAHIAGATRVFRVGGAQAVAALAYGTQTIPQVLKITGPGNIYVTLAKRMVSDTAAIDKDAGPSEVAVLADGSADPRLAAAEILTQAEHDEEACAALMTCDAAFAEKVLAAIEDELTRLSRAVIIRDALKKSGRCYIARTVEEAADLVNIFAPEHLALQTANPESILDRIPNAGCIVLGAATPVAVGDYFAGPNHILPTGRRARFESPLTTDDFTKVSSLLAYSTERLREAAPHVRALANAEELTAHARAVELRL